jgi:glucoamylase
LPGSWPSIGLGETLPCGKVVYRLDRPVGGSVHRLSVQAKLLHPIRLEIDLSCPGLTDLGPWSALPACSPPTHDRNTGRLRWSVEIEAGNSEWQWTWG